ncbi:hypothetical protein JI721_15095 [Alicyclobacillus cycloheptanicus]|uniref:DNA-binding CsgD family transcriptional regulator n=1 Tax=Alicyclobacillus cycloheptanicus TaxID=1457 RepID=A0ABT9XEU2_9BACL|nr:hypothetical protein [Alicyclobacillus cycloheptanicus]MDQ0188266.1 DNA-binding CsgD family transcriptional regulator [Alicyclobacillus cycloheptanicus]WDM00984.1 hypothetical protein JI721_15095 [Alicyclobacillus cycloheptanicus]
MGLATKIVETESITELKRRRNVETWEQSIQRLYLEGDDDKLLKAVLSYVKYRAKEYGKKYARFGVTRQDFESEFLMLAYTISQKPYNGYPYLMTLRIAIKRRALSLVERQKPKKTYVGEDKSKEVTVEAFGPDKFETIATAAGYVTEFESDTIVDIWVDEFMEKGGLTEKEQRLLRATYNDPGMTTEELMDILQVRDPKTVRRYRKSLQEKYESYSREP